jgi:hypothetical protein
MGQMAAENAAFRREVWQEVTRLHEAGEMAQAQLLYRQLQAAVPARLQLRRCIPTPINAGRTYAAEVGVAIA